MRSVETESFEGKETRRVGVEAVEIVTSDGQRLRIIELDSPGGPILELRGISGPDGAGMGAITVRPRSASSIVLRLTRR